MTALRYNPICKDFAARLAAQGKPAIVIIRAVMNKLLHIIYGVLKHGKPSTQTTIKKQKLPH
jgi:transposase